MRQILYRNSKLEDVRLMPASMANADMKSLQRLHLVDVSFLSRDIALSKAIFALGIESMSKISEN